MNAWFRLKRADSLYFAIAITVTIVELAIIATTPTLGTLALEYALVAQLALSILIEFSTAYLVIAWFGIISGTHIGFILKMLSCCLFFAGVAIAGHSFFYGWLLVISSFLFDAMGTGLLKAAFRPAYSAMYYSSTGKPADYISTLKGSGVIRLGLPCVLLFIAGIANVLATSQQAIFAMFLIVAGCRCVQIYLARSDLRMITPSPTGTSKTVNHNSIPISAAFRKAPALWVYYILGTVFESVILMYGIGLIYKYKDIEILPDAVTWMGASAISLWIYLISYAGAGYVARYWSVLKSSKVFLMLCTCLNGVVVYLLLLEPGEIGYFAGLLGFCFCASVAALLLIRHASTQFLRLFNEQDSAKIFVWTELVANLTLISIVVTATALVGPESILRIFGIFLGLSTAVAVVVYVKIIVR